MLSAIFNGHYTDNNQPLVSANNPGLKYGDGLFETILVTNNKPVLIHEHLNRFKKGLNLLNLKLPFPNPKAEIAAQIDKLLKNNNIKYGRIRITVFRGDGEFGSNNNGNDNLLIQTWNLQTPPEYNKSGLQLVVYDKARKASDAFSQIKHNNFLPFSMGMMYANERNAGDAIIMNTKGRVCETCLANIWILKDRILKTPPLEEGPIAGIMRGFLLHHFSNNKIPAIEMAFSIDELKDADEVFISNSIMLINWVENFEGKIFTNKFSSLLFTELKRDYPNMF